MKQLKSTSKKLAVDKHSLHLRSGETEAVKIISGSGSYSVLATTKKIVKITRRRSVIKVKGIATGTTTIMITDTKTKKSLTVKAVVEMDDIATGDSGIIMKTKESGTFTIIRDGKIGDVPAVGNDETKIYLDGTVLTVNKLSPGGSISVTDTETVKSVTISVLKVAPISLSHPSLLIKKGKMSVLTVSGGSRQYAAETSASNIATVTLMGDTVLVRGIDDGRCTVKVTDVRTGAFATAEITVDATLQYIDLMPSSDTLMLSLLFGKTDRDKCWLDLDGNGIRGPKSEIRMDELVTYPIVPGDHPVRIYGPVHHIYARGIKDIDISENTYIGCLELFDLVFDTPRTIDLSRHRELWRIQLFDTNIPSLDLTYNQKLQSVLVGGNPAFNHLRLGKHDKLSYIYLGKVGVTSLDVRSYPKLKYMISYMVPIQKYDISQNTLLEHFCISSPIGASLPPVKVIWADRYENMTTLIITGDSRLKVDPKKFPNLTEYECWGNNFETLDLTMYPDMKSVNCCLNRLKDIKFKSDSLEHLNVGHNQLGEDAVRWIMDNLPKRKENNGSLYLEKNPGKDAAKPYLDENGMYNGWEVRLE